MRKLKFMANCENKQELQDCTLAQNYVANLLSQNLSHYGFQTLPQSGAQVAVSVDQHALPLAVNCQSRDEDGHLDLVTLLHTLMKSKTGWSGITEKVC